MGLVGVVGVCRGCRKRRLLRSRRLCKRCYRDRSIRAKHAVIPNRRFKDLVGKVFGRLTVVCQVGVDKFEKRTWQCLCSCGVKMIATTGALTSGNTSSCRCYMREVAAKVNKTHGKRHTPEYATWAGIKTRCLHRGSRSYKNYGGRGIKMHKAWVNSFETFLAYVGQKPGSDYSLDRIDNDGNYEPGNVRWADRKMQGGNTRQNHLLTMNGETKSLGAWALQAGISYRLLSKRIQRGIPLERALHKGDLRSTTGTGARMSSEKGTYYAMLRRCQNAHDQDYRGYGGRGIEVCDRWQGKEGFKHFLADLGPRPSRHSLDRIDKDGPYSPENCRWTDAKTQGRNTRTNHVITYKGESLCIAEWEERTGLPVKVRLHKGWTIERALTAPRRHPLRPVPTTPD